VEFDASLGNAHYFSSEPGALVLGRCNYLGSGGYYAPSLYPQLAGLFTYRSDTSIAKVPDGTSNTFMFIEYAGGWINWGGGGGIPDGWDGAHWSCAFNYTGFGTPATYINSNNAGAKAGDFSWALFGSRHTGNICNIAYADASVRAVTPQIDFGTWVSLSGYRDGYLATPPDF
jgi:prepilin-type processing-associated H-X9-DG protein